MSKQKYYQGIDEFMEAHPELDPSWKEYIEPVVTPVDEDFFNYIMSFIFM
jgi:hypothetical protein